jgi:predicted GTPase
MQDIFFNFLWNNKVDKVKRNTVIGNYEDGGLKMPHVLSFVHALNISPLCQIGCDKISSGAVEESSLTDL